MGYNIVSEVGNLLVQLFCRELVPNVVQRSDNIGLCSPDDHGDFQLGIYLYDISENVQTPASGMVDAGYARQQYPSTYLNLYYMITAYSESDLKFRALQEHQILGQVVQVLRDHSVLTEEMLGGDVNMPARIEMQQIDMDEKMRVWNFPNLPYKLSLFYEVQPVEIKSAKTREVTRVREAVFSVHEV